MKLAFTGKQMKELDAFTIQDRGIPALVLMERAALAVAEEIETGGYDTGRILVVCGSGNNGADGVAAARLLHLKGYRVEYSVEGSPEKYSEELKRQRKIAENYQVKAVTNPAYGEYTVIVDALFGVGLSREIRGVYAGIIRGINESRASVVAVDIPSGLDSRTGAVLGAAVCAQATVTFAYAKTGLLLGQGRRHTGKLRVADIGIYAPDGGTGQGYMLAEERDLPGMLCRDPAGNKGTFGKVLLIAGSETMAGAAYLAGKAVLRSGAGMLKIYTSANNRDFLLQMLPEAMVAVYPPGRPDLEELERSMEWADITGIGPGLSTGADAQAVLEFFMEKNRKPCVIDADALNLLSRRPELLRQVDFPCVLTPHVGEFSRLCKKTTASIKEEPVESVRAFLDEYPVTVVCKNACTVTACRDKSVWLNTSGSSALATAGSGDVLTGILLGFLAQADGHFEEQRVPLCVYLHGWLGERAAIRLSTPSVTAGDLLEELVHGIRALEKDGR